MTVTGAAAEIDVDLLNQIQQRVLWLSTFLIHYSNNIRPNRDATKVGGHQASCASVVTLLTTYYFAAAEPGDLIAIKPHASPVYHVIQYLLGNLSLERLRQFRSFGGLQAYPCRSKDPDGVQISTGSVGFGAVMPNFMALAHRYLEDHFGEGARHRFLALIGDAELDEGSIWEALGESLLQRLGNVIWMIDLNRQSLDRVVPSGREQKIAGLLRSFGCHVIEVKYGRRLEEVFSLAGGERLRRRIDEMSNEEYQSLLRLKDPALLRTRLSGSDPELAGSLARLEPSELGGFIADLGGHDFGALLGAFREAKTVTDRPVAIIAYTIKGWGLPLAGDPLNHSRLLTNGQIEELRVRHGIAAGAEFDRFPDGSEPGRLCAGVVETLYQQDRPAQPRTLVEVPASLDSTAYTGDLSTQQAFGHVLTELARYQQVRSRIVTTSPDVSVSTNLGGWIQKAGVYSTDDPPDYFGDSLTLKWKQSTRGQHVELGISENNLFLMLGAFGVAGDLLGEQVVPVGTLYDTFISRGLDALHYAIYNGGRFIFAGTPSGISLSPEGGLHQSLLPPSFGIESPRLTYFEPCFAQEVEWILLDSIRRILNEPRAESVYLRLSTVPQAQTLFPRAAPDLRRNVLAGGYLLVDHRQRPAYRPDQNVVNLFTCGVMVPHAVKAAHELAGDELFVNVINVTSPDLLHRGWVQAGHARMNGLAARHHLESLIPEQERRCPIVTLLDGHPHALSFLGSVFGARTTPLGVDEYGQSGSREDLYNHYEIGVASIVAAAIAAVS
jgi:pyruvate dehydrogenase E1 component